MLQLSRWARFVRCSSSAYVLAHDVRRWLCPLLLAGALQWRRAWAVGDRAAMPIRRCPAATRLLHASTAGAIYSPPRPAALPAASAQL